MAATGTRAPRGTRAVITAIMDALDAIPEINRKAAFKHAAAAVREKLVARAEKAKSASRSAPRRPGAKKAAAISATRRAAAQERSSGRSPRKTSAASRRGRKPLALGPTGPDHTVGS